MGPNPLADFGGGLSSKSLKQHPAGPPQHGPTGQAERAFTAASTFMSGVMAISATQFLGAPLKMIDPKFYEAYMAFTKQSFGVLITTMTQWWSPTVVRVSGDQSIPKQLFQKPDGTLQCRFPKRIVMMANHQLYTDWLYLWWVAYTNNMHGYIYIILKESLKNVPIIGWGAQFYNFIFLSRKWEQDQDQFKSHLDQLNNPDDPMWLLIFPEGTNLAKGTKEKSAEWAKKTGVQDMKHQLLPRSRGIQFCLQNLRKTTDWLYDCTIGYEGIPPGEFGQDIFTLRSSMFEGRPPKSVNMHFRRFRISEIPIDNDKAFDVWLRNRWREKDYLLEHFVRYDRFPEDDKWLVRQQKKNNKIIAQQNAKFIETQIKSNNLEEFLSIFAPLTSVMTVLAVMNGTANPNDLLKMVSEATQQQHQVGLLEGAGPTKDLQKKIEKASTANMPNLTALQKTGSVMPTAAQRNMIQKYISAVRPTVEKQISLSNQSLRLSNAGKGEFSLRSNQKPGTLVQKVPNTAKSSKTPSTTKPKTSVAKIASSSSERQPLKLSARRPSIETIGTASTVPTTHETEGISSTHSIAPSSSISTAPSTKPRTVAAGKAPLKPWVTQSKSLQPTAHKIAARGPISTKASSQVNTTQTAPKPKVKTAASKPSVKTEPPTVKMDQETYDRLRKQNEIGAAGKKPVTTPTAPRNVNMDPATLAKLKAKPNPVLKSAQKQPNRPASEKKSVQIDPAILAKMKEGKK